MKKQPYLILSICVLAVTACSTTPNCLEQQPYMQAKSFPPLQSPPGLDVPEPDSTMRVPDVASGPIGTYDQPPPDANPDDPAARCLVTPPAMASG